MAHQDCPNVAQITLEMECDGQSIFQDWYFLHPGGWPLGAMQTLANDFRSAFQSDYPTLFSVDTSFIRVVAVDLSSLATERAVDAFGPGETGTVTGVSAANNVCWAVTKSTGQRGRGQQGRIFWGPIPAASVVSNSISESLANNIIGAINAVISAGLTGFPTAQHVVLSRYSGVDPVTHKPIPRPFGVGLPVHSMTYTNLDTDSQRDRLPGHRKHKAR
jgi:hypothetical protein